MTANLFGESVTIPRDRLTGKQFESIVRSRLAEYQSLRLADIGDYGVQARTDPLAPIGPEGPVWKPIKSLPDFEGPLMNGPQVITDAKVDSKASFSWSAYRSNVALGKKRPGAKYLQLKHMLRRSVFGSVCFFLIHWNELEQQRRHYPPSTWAVPVRHTDSYWDEVERGTIKSLSRIECEDWCYPVDWGTLSTRKRTNKPQLISVIRQMVGDR